MEQTLVFLEGGEKKKEQEKPELSEMLPAGLAFQDSAWSSWANSGMCRKVPGTLQTLNLPMPGASTDQSP